MACNASCSAPAALVGPSSRRKLQQTGFAASWVRQRRRFNALQFRIRAVKAPEECNEEECAPPKEVGKVSMEWIAEEKTKVQGTFPPMTKQNRITGYVEKDSAGQTNVYAVEPPVYVAESAISTGAAGASAEGSDITLGLVGVLGFIALAGISSILLQESRNMPSTPQAEYSGPPLSYYISKFQSRVAAATEAPPVEAAATSPAASPVLTVQTEAPPVEAAASTAPVLTVQSEAPPVEAAATTAPVLTVQSEAPPVGAAATTAPVLTVQSEASPVEASATTAPVLTVQTEAPPVETASTSAAATASGDAVIEALPAAAPEAASP